MKQINNKSLVRST